MSKNGWYTLGILLIAYIVCMTVIILATRDDESTAHEANRLCSIHRGVGQNGIHAEFVICSDGYVAER